MIVTEAALADVAMRSVAAKVVSMIAESQIEAASTTAGVLIEVVSTTAEGPTVTASVVRGDSTAIGTMTEVSMLTDLDENRAWTSKRSCNLLWECKVRSQGL